MGYQGIFKGRLWMLQGIFKSSLNFKDALRILKMPSKIFKDALVTA
jgi:hypothetical protein